MFVTSSAERAGVLVAVVSGGRPDLKLRPSSGFLRELEAVGAEVVWIVNEREAAEYERDGREVVTYPDDWAYEYARENWTNPATPLERGGFYGVFPGREFACREAERRGKWAVLQVDDNIRRRYCLRATRGGTRVVDERGGLGFYLDLLAGVALSARTSDP